MLLYFLDKTTGQTPQQPAERKRPRTYFNVWFGGSPRLICCSVDVVFQVNTEAVLFVKHPMDVSLLVE